MRAVLVALLLLAPLPGAAAACTVAGVCHFESSTGSDDCRGLGSGATNASVRNVHLGFPVTAAARGERSCSAVSRTDTVTTNATAGRHGSVDTHWTSTSSTGWRYVRANATTAAGDARVFWYGDEDRCRLESNAAATGMRWIDYRDCPVHVLPPAAPPLSWGNLLP